MWRSSYSHSTTCEYLTTLQLFDIRQIVGGISGEYEYFISFNLIELYWILHRKYWQWREHNTALWTFHFLNWTGLTELCLRYRCWFSLLYLDVSLHSDTGIEKFFWGWISICIRYSTNSKVNICIWRIQIFFCFVTFLIVAMYTVSQKMSPFFSGVRFTIF